MILTNTLSVKLVETAAADNQYWILLDPRFIEQIRISFLFVIQ